MNITGHYSNRQHNDNENLQANSSCTHLIDAHLVQLNLIVSPKYRGSILAFVHFSIVTVVVMLFLIVQHLVGI